MQYTNEIVLFHVEDPQPARHNFTTPNATLFDVCIRSIRANSPGSRIVLLTAPGTHLHAAYPDVVCMAEPVNTGQIMYERSRMYKDFVALRCAEGSTLPITLMDIDIIVNRDLADVSALPFDVGLTWIFLPHVELDARGLATNTQISPINGGVIFCRPTPAACAFFTEQMRMFDRLHAEGNIPQNLTTDIRKWGGDQYALMAMLGKTLFARRGGTTHHAGALVRFFPSDIYNYTPPKDTKFAREMFAPKYLIHMKGRMKDLMLPLAQWLGIP